VVAGLRGIAHGLAGGMGIGGDVMITFAAETVVTCVPVTPETPLSEIEFERVHVHNYRSPSRITSAQRRLCTRSSIAAGRERPATVVVGGPDCPPRESLPSGSIFNRWR